MTKLLASIAAAATLAGCASLTTLDSEVSTFSRWPAGRTPATYAFDRLPSQQVQPQQSQVLEDAARRAIEAAGFVAAPEGALPDVSIQLGARITETDRSPFDDPFWYGHWGSFHRPFGYGRHGRPFWGPGWRHHAFWGYDRPHYEREVAVLIRDKRSGEPLYEARATSDGATPAPSWSLPAMFTAALKDFPNGGANPRQVRVKTRAQAASAPR